MKSSATTPGLLSARSLGPVPPGPLRRRLPERPVIPGFHPDPSVCRVGDHYFLVNSSFEYFPGVPIHASTDLLTWRQLGHVLDREDQFSPGGILDSGGIYAPTVRHHAGRFWVITTNVSDGPGQILVTAERPEGPWSDPVRIPHAVGIDPDLAWEEDGTCWLSWSGQSPASEQGILQARLDVITGELLSPISVAWRGTGGQFPEGPHLYFHDGWWYLLIAEGGTERGHSVTIARGPTPTGPFEASPHNPLLTARSTDLAVQNTGHADLVQRPDGTWAMVFLGVRPHGSTPGFHVLGRETFVCEVEWIDGWPRIGAPIEPTPEPVVEELAGEQRPFWWVGAANAPTLRRDGDGWMVGSPDDVTERFEGRRQQHRLTTTTARLSPGTSRGGLEIRIDRAHRCSLQVSDNRVEAVAIVGGNEVPLGHLQIHGAVDLVIRTLESDGPTGTTAEGPDLIVLGVRIDDEFRELGRWDGRYVSTEVASGFTGRFIGIVSQGPVRLVSFRYQSDENRPHLSFDVSTNGESSTS